MKPPSDAPHVCVRYLRGHEASAPELSPRTWYGMPAYAKSGKVVCFFQGYEDAAAASRTLDPRLMSILDEVGHRACSRAMNVSLTPKLEAYVRHKVAAGLYNNASEVVRARRGLGLLMLLRRTGPVLRRMREAVSWIEADISCFDVRGAVRALLRRRAAASPRGSVPRHGRRTRPDAARRLEESLHLLDEPRPCRFGLDEDVVVALER